ncbi:MAG: cupin domain-containing protein [Salinirussus sp.]
MSDTSYEIVDPAQLDWEYSERGTAHSRNLAGALGCEKLTPRLWRLEPGETMSRHRHEEQEEFYFLLSGPGGIRLEDELHTLEPGHAVRVSPPVARRLENVGDEPVTFLAVAAPPRHHDGVHL